MFNPIPPLQTPHSGYHWDGSARRFFEGWYFRVTLPAIGQSFAFMYSIDDPIGGKPQSGGAAQILGPDERYFCRTLPDVKKFWASCDRIALSHSRSTQRQTIPCDLSPTNTEFEPYIQEGYKVTATQHQGHLYNPATDETVSWQYEITPIYGWGDPTRRQQATAGWLSYFSIFEPGWQVLMAHGQATGWIEWRGQRYSFEQAPAYAEKNWGGAFPEKWFWMQCNAFESEPDLTLTAAGGIRQVLNRAEAVALIGVHYRNCFYEFLSTATTITWDIAPWGNWRMTAQSHRYSLQIQGDTQAQGNWVRVPTRDGLQFICRDTTHGRLELKLWDQHNHNLVHASSTQAGLEIGGHPWETSWIQ